MLWDASALKGYDIQASDGQLGTVSDILFEDESWLVRWLVVDTGTWLPGRKVLLPISALGEPDAALRQFPVKLTKQQVKNSPDIDTDRPVSRQFETAIYDYYGWSPYWSVGYVPTSPAIATPFVRPLYISEPLPRAHVGGEAERADNPHLRSVAALTGYHIHATDGAIGHVDDFLIDDAGWGVRYLVVDTKNWWPGKSVLVSPGSVQRIDTDGTMMYLAIDRKSVKNSPDEDTVMANGERPDLREYREKTNKAGSIGAMRNPSIVLVEPANHSLTERSFTTDTDIVSPAVGRLPPGQSAKE